MFCSNCGNKISEKDLYCGSCGSKNTNTPNPTNIPKIVIGIFTPLIVIVLIIITISAIVTFKKLNPTELKDSSFEERVNNIKCGNDPCFKSDAYEIVDTETKVEEKRSQKYVTYKIKNTDLTFSIKSKYTCIKTGDLCIDGSCTCKKRGYALVDDYEEKAIEYLVNEYNKTTFDSGFKVVNNLATVDYNVKSKSDLNKFLYQLSEFKKYFESKDYYVDSVLIDINTSDGVHSGVTILLMYYKNGEYYFSGSASTKEELVSIEDYIEEDLKSDNVSLSY